MLSPLPTPVFRKLPQPPFENHASSPEPTPEDAVGSTRLVAVLLGMFVLLGAVISGFAAMLGGHIAGMRAAGVYDLRPTVDMLRFAFVSVFFSVSLILIWSRGQGGLRPRHAIVPLLLVPLLSLALGLYLQLQVKDHNPAREREAHREGAHGLEGKSSAHDRNPQGDDGAVGGVFAVDSLSGFPSWLRMVSGRRRAP